MENKIYQPSLLNGFINKQSRPIEWLEVFNLITNEKLKELTEKFRATKEWRYKASLPCITPSCQLDGNGKEAADIAGLTGVSMADFDHLPADRIEDIRAAVNADKHTLMSYVTVSGEGLRVLFLGSFRIGNSYYSDLIGFPYDEKCSNVNRLSALCHDPKAYFNPDAEALGVNAIDYAVKVIERSERYEPGNRNQYLMRCLMMMNKLGVPQCEAEQWALGHDLGEREIRSVVKSCYSHISEHGTFSVPDPSSPSAKTCACTPGGSLAHTRARESDDASDDYLYNPAPLLPEHRWPKIIQDMIDCGETDAQRDVILLSSFTVFGSMLSRRLRVLYARKYWYPCLQTFVVAPPASGKGAIGWVRRLAEPMHNSMMQAWTRAMSEYKRQKQAYDAAGRERANMEQPEMPPMRMFLITGNNSSTGILENIMDAGGCGLICEAEADTVSSAINADYGGWSDVLRKVFEHERLAYNRRTNHEYRETESSRLSVLLSGTAAQVKPLIPSAENGLYSRQVFYTMPPIDEWIDQFSNDGIDIEALFKRWGIEWKEKLDSLDTTMSMAELKLTEEQQGSFNRFFSSLFAHASGTYSGHHRKSSVARMAINILRMMSVTAFLRSLEESGDMLVPAANIPEENVKDGVCSRFDLSISDDDFDAVLSLADPLYRHSGIVLGILPEVEAERREMKPMDLLLSELPLEFSHSYALDASRKLGISDRTLDSRLSRMVSRGMLVRTDRGVYRFSHATHERVCAREPRGVQVQGEVEK